MDMLAVNDEVTTFDGKIVDRYKNGKKYARYIQGQYYEIGVTCFSLKNEEGVEKLYRITSTNLIAFNNETKTYDLITKLSRDKSLVKGIVDSSKKMVYFKKDLSNNVYLLEGLNESQHDNIVCINSDLAKELGYMECLHSEFWYNKRNLSTKELQHLQSKKKVAYPEGFKVDYNANSTNKTFLNIKKEYELTKDKIKIDSSVEDLESFIKHYSFGLEMETSIGTIPSTLLGKLGLVPLKDGSINGYEYTTLPLSGTVGLQTLKNATFELIKRCDIDNRCSLHVHIGGFKRTKLFVMAQYMLAYKIQNELFEMFPEYKKDQIAYLGSAKNYCRLLPDLKLGNNTLYSQRTSAEKFDEKLQTYFDKLFSYYAGGHLSGEDESYNFNKYIHPQDTQGNQKWHITNRYHWINLVPTIFSKSETVEHRLHQATINPIKISNWLFITLAITRFCEKYQKEIIARKIDYTLDTILDCYKDNFGDGESRLGSDIAEYLKAYVKERKKYFRDRTVSGDYICDEELKKDTLYTFSHNKLNTIW